MFLNMQGRESGGVCEGGKDRHGNPGSIVSRAEGWWRDFSLWDPAELEVIPHNAGTRSEPAPQASRTPSEFLRSCGTEVSPQGARNQK